MQYKAIPILLKHAGWFSRKPKWDDDDGFLLDMPIGEIIELPDGTKTFSIGGGYTIDLPDDYFDDDDYEPEKPAKAVKKAALMELNKRRRSY